jgi:hypothetical protein
MGLADLVNGHDVWMPQATGGTCLRVETSDIVRRRQSVREDPFNCDGAIEIRLARTENHTHAAAADLLKQFIFAELLWRCQFRTCRF